MAEPDPELDLKREQRKIVRNSVYALLLSTVVFATAHLLVPRFIRFGGEDLESRLTFWAGSNLFVLLWLMYSVRLVSGVRFRSREDNRGSAYSPPSPKIAVAIANLQNTLEQSVLFIFTQLALVLLVGGRALPLVAASVLLFLIGRAAFLRAYPNGAGARGFGMALTAMPIIFAFLLNVGVLLGRLW
jgi:uncharacterized MAPEG superfamily protein